MSKMQSYKEIAELVKGIALPISGQNEKGEIVIISRGHTEEGLGRSFLVETLQNNGWSCIHTYWEDGTKEETFKHSNTETKAQEEKVAPDQALKEALLGWVDKVMKTYEQNRKNTFSCVNTYRMIQDADKIIAEAFDHDPVLQ